MSATFKTPHLTVEETSAVLFDHRLIRDWLSYLFHSIGRHPALAILTLLTMLGGSIVAGVQLPKHYEAKTRLLSNANLLSAPNPYGGPTDDLPAIAAREKILSRDALEKIVVENDLLAGWEKTRTPLFRVKDQVMQKLTGRWTAEDRLEMMIGTLAKRMKVKAEKGTIEISVVWPDAFAARQIVETAQQNFLETRHLNEVSTKSENIAVLEGYQKALDQEISTAFGSLKRVSEERSRVIKASLAATAPQPAPLPKIDPNDSAKAAARAAEVGTLKFQLRTRQRSIQDLEDWRTRSLSDLRSQLETQRLTYQKSHPVIQQLEQRIASVERDSPQLAALRREELDLTRQVESRGGGAQPQTMDFLLMDSRRFPFVLPGAEGAGGPQDTLERELQRDPSMMVATDALRTAMVRSQELRARIDGARIELDSARAAYKYSFSVVNPAQTPRKPEWPNVPLLILLGALSGLLFALLACTALDVWRGRVVEEWQIRRTLNLPVLSTVRL